MAVTLKSYYLNSYTNGTWTELASPGSGEVLAIRMLILCNTAAESRYVSVRVTESNGSTVRALLVDTYELSDGETIIYGPKDFLLALENQEQLQVKADAADVHFTAGGGYE